MRKTINKAGNEYADALIPGGQDAPKAVIAAVCASFAMRLGEDPARAFVAEWAVLHANGILPQPVPKAFRAVPHA